MRPLIGIVARVEFPGGTKRLTVREEYRREIHRHGGNALAILPPEDIDYTNTRMLSQKDLGDEEKEQLIDQIKLCDGIVMPGGFKVNKFDRFICEYAIDNNIPILGICLGMQIMANYKVENYWVDINATGINHKVETGYVHNVTLDKDSKLYSIIGEEKFKVNSRHNYHALPNKLFDIVALSDDNVIEAIEMKDKKFTIGVQWHPEDLEDEESNKIFRAFIDSCK